MPLPFKSYYYKITILTHVHIGTGEELEPIDYFLDKNKLVRVDRDLLHERLLLNNKYDMLNKLGDSAMKGRQDYLPDLRNLHKNYLADSIDLHGVEVDGYLYSKLSNNNKIYDTSCRISELMNERATHLPYLPGTTLKGMLKTAFLSECSLDSSLSKRCKITLSMQNYNDIEGDPFALLKVSDFTMVHGKKQICTVQNHIKKSWPTKRPPKHDTNLETILPEATFIGQITYCHAYESKKYHFDINDIETTARNHGLNCYRNFENPEFTFTNRQLESINDTTIPIKIGLHAGSYVRAIRSLARIETRHSKFPQKQPDTIWRAKNSNQNMGWALMQRISDDEAKELLILREQLVTNIVSKRRAIVDSIRNSNLQHRLNMEEKERQVKTIAEAKARERKAEEERKAAEEARLEAMLNSDDSEVWAAAFATKEWNRVILPYFKDTNKPLERRKALARHYFERPENKETLKSYRKKFFNNNDNEIIKIIVKLIPEKFQP